MPTPLEALRGPAQLSDLWLHLVKSVLQGSTWWTCFGTRPVLLLEIARAYRLRAVRGGKRPKAATKRSPLAEFMHIDPVQRG
jgi:hypothetical protein